jgi:hypothetical protein
VGPAPSSKRPGRLLFATGLAILVAAAWAAAPTAPSATMTPEDDLRASLAENGVVFKPLSASDLAKVAPSIVSTQVAIQVATAAFSVANPPTAYLGRLIASAGHDEGVVAYGVRLTPLSLPPFGGGRWQTADRSMPHTEMVVFVDAQSATVLLATDYR